MNENYINHIALVLDESGSMNGLRDEVIKVADAEIKHLAKRSQELDQETRITVYTFSDTIKCIVYDKDVLRLPSLKQCYRPSGNTALIDATIKSVNDLLQTPQLYGDHAFLIYVLTDGQENASRNKSSSLAKILKGLEENWTLAVLVPSAKDKFEAQRFGFAPENVAVWDATSKKGFNDAGETIHMATDNFMSMRSSGMRGTRKLFSLDVSRLNKKTLESKLDKIPYNQYRAISVSEAAPIANYVEKKLGIPYRIGSAYYQLTKSEQIQASKKIAIMDRSNYNLYIGDAARSILGLPDYEVKVHPSSITKYDVFVQSTSVNRKLVPGTKLLIISDMVTV